MEKDTCEPYRALKDGLKAVKASEVKFSICSQIRFFWISDFPVSGERHPCDGKHPKQEQDDRFQDWTSGETFRGAWHCLQEIPSSSCCFEVQLSKLLLSWFIFVTFICWGALSCIPTLATCCWSWRTLAWLPGRTSRSCWQTWAEWRCSCTGLPTLLTLLQVECKSSLGYLSLSHSYCSATRALITSFLEVLHKF